MQKLPTLLELLKAGAHFGHQKSRWHPKMAEYLFGSRNGVHVINLEKTLEELEKTLAFVKGMAAEGKLILFVGTKRQARSLVRVAAESCGMPFLTERWIGGMLTNFDEVKRRLRKYRQLKEMVANNELIKYTKQEQSRLKKQIEKMDRYLIGLEKLEKIPDAVYVADMRTEKTAVTEANRTGVTIVAVCDSNVNPDKADYIIPANDDAVNSIKVMADLMAAAVNEGRAEWEKKKVAIKEAAAKAEPMKTVPVATEPRKERKAVKKEESL